VIVASIRRRRDRKGTRWIVDCRDVPGGRRLTVGTREEAEMLRAEMVRQAQQAQPVPQDRDITLDAFADRWLGQITVSVEANTLASYRQNLAKHIRPAFGSMKLRAIHRGHVRALVARKRADGLSGNSVRLIRATLSVMLGDAVDDAIIFVNPAAGAGRRGRRRPDMGDQAGQPEKVRVMTYEQLATFLAASEARCDRRAHGLFLLLADAGLRPGEACGVKWADFDAVARTLRVERAVTNGGQVKATKTGGARLVDLSRRLATTLADRQARLKAEAAPAGEESIGPWAFERSAGRPVRPRQVSKLFSRLVQSAGLPRFVLYDLRHSYASHLIASGATIDYVSKQLGHASPLITLSVYTHFFPRGDRSHLERMEQRRADVPPAPVVQDKMRLTLDAPSVNEGSWHRFGTAGENSETEEAERLEFRGAEGAERPIVRLYPIGCPCTLAVLAWQQGR